jgi:hypothetical protein
VGPRECSTLVDDTVPASQAFRLVAGKPGTRPLLLVLPEVWIVTWILLVLRFVYSLFFPPTRGLGSLAVRRDGRVRCVVRQDDPWDGLREAWNRLIRSFTVPRRRKRDTGGTRPPCNRPGLLRGVD